MDSKFIKSHQCSLERSHVALVEINPEFSSDLGLFRQKQIFTGLLVTKYFIKRAMKIFCIQLLYSWLHLTNNNFPPLYIPIEEIPVQPISLIQHTSLDFKYHPIQEYFKQIYNWDLCRFLQPGVISSTIFYQKLDFPTANHNIYIKLNCAQFPMIGNTEN